MASSKSGSFRSIVWPLAVAETIVWAAMYYSFPALLLEWEKDFGWSKTELTGALTLALLVSAAAAPFAGRIIDHGHGRRLLTSSALFGASLLMVLSQVTQLWQFYAVWFLLGFAMAGCLYDACFAILTRTMGDKTKRAITLVTLVAGLAGTVSVPSANARSASRSMKASSTSLSCPRESSPICLRPSMSCFGCCSPTTATARFAIFLPRSPLRSRSVEIRSAAMIWRRS